MVAISHMMLHAIGTAHLGRRSRDHTGFRRHRHRSRAKAHRRKALAYSPRHRRNMIT